MIVGREQKIAWWVFIPFAIIATGLLVFVVVLCDIILLRWKTTRYMNVAKQNAAGIKCLISIYLQEREL